MADPLVMIPGPLMDARIFLPQFLALGDMAAIHLARMSRLDTIEAMAQDVLDTAPACFSLLGHGVGGIVALEVLRRAPDRVTRIALAATEPLTDSPAVGAAREALLVKARAGRFDEVLAADPAITAYLRQPDNADLGELLVTMALEAGIEAYASQVRALQRRPDQQRTLRVTRVPALVLGGGADPWLHRKRMEFTAGLMPNARLSVVPGIGHLPMLEAPGLVNAALRDWLTAPLVLTRMVS